MVWHYCYCYKEKGINENKRKGRDNRKATEEHSGTGNSCERSADRGNHKAFKPVKAAAFYCDFADLRGKYSCTQRAADGEKKSRVTAGVRLDNQYQKKGKAD